MSYTHLLVLSERAVFHERMSLACEFAGLVPSFVHTVEDISARIRDVPVELIVVDLVGSHAPLEFELGDLLDARGLLPLLFVGTGNEVISSAEAAEAVGADGFVFFPVAAETLMHRVADILHLDMKPVPDSVVFEAEGEGGLLPLSQEGSAAGGEPVAPPAPAKSSSASSEPTSPLKRRVDRLRRRRGGSDIGEPAPEEAALAATLEGGPVPSAEASSTGEQSDEAAFSDPFGAAALESDAFESDANVTVPNLAVVFPTDDVPSGDADVMAFVSEADRGHIPQEVSDRLPETSATGDAESDDDPVPEPPPFESDEGFNTPTANMTPNALSFDDELDAAVDAAGKELSARIGAMQRERQALDTPDDPFAVPAAVDAPPSDAPPAFNLDSEDDAEATTVNAPMPMASAFDYDDGFNSPDPFLPTPPPIEPPTLAAADIAAAESAVSSQVEATEVVLRSQMQSQIDAEIQRALRLQAEQNEAERIEREAGLLADAERKAEERFSLELKRQIAQVRRDAEEGAQRRLTDALAEERGRAERTREELTGRLQREAGERVEAEVKAARAELETELNDAHQARLAELQQSADDERQALLHSVRSEAQDNAKNLLDSTIADERKRGEREVQEKVTEALEAFEQRTNEERQRLEAALRQDFESRLSAEADDVEERVREEERARAESEIDELLAMQAEEQDALEKRLLEEAAERKDAAVKARSEELSAQHQAELAAEIEAVRQDAQAEAEAERTALEARLRAEAAEDKEQALKQKLGALRDELTTEANRRLKAELGRQQAQYEKAQQARDAAYAGERAQIEAGHDEERARLQDAHDAERLRLEEEYAQERARLAASHDAEQSRRTAEHAQQTDALQHQVAAARESVDAAAERIEAERAAFAEKMAQAVQAAEAEREALAERIRQEAERAASARADDSVRAMQAQLRVVAEERLAAELERQSQVHQEEIRALTERVRAETEAHAHASFEHQLQRFEQEAVRAAEERARTALAERLRDVERREQLAKARLAFQSGALGAVVPGDADDVEPDTLGREPWRADGLTPVGHSAFLPSGNTTLTPMDPDRIEPMDPLDGGYVDGELPALLWTAHFQGVTGKIEFTHRDGKSRELFLESGEPVGFVSELARDRPEHALLAAGLITAQKHAELHAGPLLSARRMCSQLVDDGELKTSELFAAVRGVLTEQILSLLEWGGGSYRYFEERAHPSDRVRLEMRFDAILADGIRRKYDEERLWRVLGGPATIIAPDRRALRLPPLPPAEQATLQYFDGSRPLEDVILSVGASADIVLRAALIAVSSGIGLVAARGMPMREEDRSARRERDMKIDATRIQEKLRIARDGDYFQFLGVRTDATNVEIQRAAGTIRRRFNIDAFADPAYEQWREGLEEIADVARDAESVLCDPRLRAAYERRRKKAVKAVAQRRRTIH